MKNWPFFASLLPFVQDIDRLAPSVDYYAAHCSLISCYVRGIYDLMERRNFSQENERQGEQLFLSPQVPNLRKCPNLYGRVSFLASPKPGCII